MQQSVFVLCPQIMTEIDWNNSRTVHSLQQAANEWGDFQEIYSFVEF